jgi:hypothetical protein
LGCQLFLLSRWYIFRIFELCELLRTPYSSIVRETIVEEIPTKWLFDMAKKMSSTSYAPRQTLTALLQENQPC